VTSVFGLAKTAKNGARMRSQGIIGVFEVLIAIKSGRIRIYGLAKRFPKGLPQFGAHIKLADV